MSEKSKIEIAIGEFKFTGEGEEKWLSQQLDKILEKAQALVKLAPAKVVSDAGTQTQARANQSTDVSNPLGNIPLAKFLSQHNATTNQVKKFLAAAVWLTVVKGKTNLTPADITNALREASQSKLNNASLCLTRNIQKSLCEKNGKEFMVTVHGREEFGINE